MKNILFLFTILFFFNCASAQKANAIKATDLSVEISEIERAKTFYLSNTTFGAKDTENDEAVRFLIKFKNQSKELISIYTFSTELKFETLVGNKPKEMIALPKRVEYPNAGIGFLAIFKLNINLQFDFDLPPGESDSREIYYIIPKGSKLKSVSLGANGGVAYPILDSSQTN